MTLQRYAVIGGWIALAALAVLLVAGFVRNPTQAARKEFERQLAESAPSGIDINLESGPNLETWQRAVSGRAELWGPLVPPQKAEAPAPMLLEMLKGVEPTNRTLGSGSTQRIQIKVDGKKEYYGKGQQVKGCTIEEITANDVLFTLVQDGKVHGTRLPRK